MHEHVVHRLLERVGVDALGHRQVALRDPCRRTARGGLPRRRPRRGSAWSWSWRRRPSDWRTRSPWRSSSRGWLRSSMGVKLHSRLYSQARREFLHRRGRPLVQAYSGRVDSLLDRRLIFVTGKGGVGKSTVATALGLLAARRGRRTVVAELASQERVQRTFDRSGRALPRARARARAVHDLDRPPARDGRVPARQARSTRTTARRRAGCSPFSRWPRPECASCSASARFGSSRSSSAGLAVPRRMTS